MRSHVTGKEKDVPLATDPDGSEALLTLKCGSPTVAPLMEVMSIFAVQVTV